MLSSKKLFLSLHALRHLGIFTIPRCGKSGGVILGWEIWWSFLGVAIDARMVGIVLVLVSLWRGPANVTMGEIVSQVIVS